MQQFNSTNVCLGLLLAFSWPGLGQFGAPGASYPINDINHLPDSFKAQPITGKVRLSDGSIPPQPVLLVRICNGFVRPGAISDNKGKFTFRHRKDDIPADESALATEDAAARVTGGYRSRLGVKQNKVASCELRALLPGYTAEPVLIDNGRSELTNVGTIVLRPSAGEGSVISLTSLSAPPGARNAFESSWTESSAGRLAEAERHLKQAVELYPEYAAAWYELGRLQTIQQDTGAAKASFSKAIAADTKYTSPYDQLALLAAREERWQDANDNMDKLLKLSPADFPAGWLLAAIAKFHLGNLDGAADCARTGILQDPAHILPKLHLVLGMALIRKKEYSEASTSLANYLREAPHASDYEAVKKQLAQLKTLEGATGGNRTQN